MTKATETSEKQNEIKEKKKEIVETSRIKTPQVEALSKEQLEISEWLNKIKFKKSLIGGVNEQDVWKKIHQLNEKFKAALKAERVRYDVLLQEQRKNVGYNSFSTKDSEESS